MATAATLFLLYTSLQEEVEPEAEEASKQEMPPPEPEQDAVSLWRHRCDFLQEQTRLLSLEFQPQRVPLSQTGWLDLLIEMEQLTGDLEQMATMIQRPLPLPLPTATSPLRHRFFCHHYHIVVFTVIVVAVVISFIWAFSSIERLFDR